MANLILNGYLQASGDGCGCSAAGQDSATMRLGLRCSPAYYQSAINTPVPLQISTPGAPGDNFQQLDALDGFVGIEFLAVRTNAPMVLCIDAGPAELTSDPITIPTGFVGGETLVFGVDLLTVVTVVFDAADQTLAQVVARINAACALAGLPTPRCQAVGTTQFKLIGIACGFDPTVPSAASITIISAPPQLPFTTTQAFAQGTHVEVNGLFLAEFPAYPNAPKRVEVSGQGSLTLMAAGRTTA